MDKSDRGAGPNIVFDPLAARIIKRARIETLICDGRNLSNLMAAIEGQEFNGTIIEADRPGK